MGKKGKQNANKAAVKAAKKDKQAKKVDIKVKKKKGDEGIPDGDDLIQTLEEFRKKWEEDHKVTEDIIDGPPSRRANASLTPDPVNPHLWLFGGEFFDGTSAHFYNDFYRFTPEKNEWRRLSSPTFPGPRSAHQVVATPGGGGKLWLFGGEFASLNQTSFHHYRDLWCFDISTTSWERIETKVKPSARSGHRMAVWKQWIVLFGGFHDVGIRTNYLNDLWVFDTVEYRWHQYVAKDTERWPGPRSGFSLLSLPEGLVLHGGYSKKYTSKTKFVGVPHDDTFFLPLTLTATGECDFTKLKWDKRKRLGQVPSLRSGCTMVVWGNRGMALGFGGVKDVEEEEALVSEFYQDLFAYQLAGNGRWLNMNLKKKKKPNANKKKKKQPLIPVSNRSSDAESDDGLDEEERAEEARLKREAAARDAAKIKAEEAADDSDPDDPEKSIPLPRYNTMLAVLRNTLYVYGGIFESNEREYTLQSFYSLALDKMDRYVCLREDDIKEHEWNESESGSDDEDDEEGDEEESSEEDEEGDEEVVPAQEEEEQTPEEQAEEAAAVDPAVAEEAAKAALRKQAETFIGVAKGVERPEEEVMSTPLPGETLKVFYDRSRSYWTQKAHEKSDNRGKELRRDGFAYAEERYLEYKPLLDEIEKIQAEAGIEAADMQRRVGPGASGAGVDSRHRR